MKKILFTSLILVLGLSAAHAGRRYVGFGTPATGENLRAALVDAIGSHDTIYVAAGIYNSGDEPFLVAPGSVLIGGYAKYDSATLTRRYPGQFMFLPTSSSDLSNTTEFTVLDGNSLKLPANKKHRVIDVYAIGADTGVVDGCLIRNGHVRNDDDNYYGAYAIHGGGGVLLKGGKLYNSIVRGNVAMVDKPSLLSYNPKTKVKTGAFGGGVYIMDNGEMVNCLVAYNMANDGYGVAIGPGGGRTINNTVTANTYAPSFAKIAGTAAGYQMYAGKTSGEWADFRGTNAKDSVPRWTPVIKFTDDFYMSRTLTTESQYAVFCAAIDIAIKGDSGQFSIDTLSKIKVKNPFESQGATVGANYTLGTGMQSLLTSNVTGNEPGLTYKNGIWHPHADTLSMEYPMGKVSWYGALAYSVWLGGGLPTEARWEFAARRNPTGTPEVNENLYSGAYGSTVAVTDNDKDTATWRILDSIAWTDKTVSIDTGTNKLGFTSPWGDRVHEVARKRPNAVGLYDMTGLLREWCADAPIATATTDPGYTNDTNNPKPAASTTTTRTVRGGSWDTDTRSNFALSYRTFVAPTTGNKDIGFRPFIDLR